MEDRMNSEQSMFVKIQLFGLEMRIAQDPNSQHLGKTVWDASMVLAKYLERNENKGEFSRKKLAGKRALELGAGLGLAGMGLCLLGCNVVTTDQRDVLPMLQQNIDWNVSGSVMSAAGHALRGPLGEVTVAELDWGNEEQIKAVSPPFDLVVAADVLYAEHLVEPLLRTIAAVTGPRTTTLISYELRSQSVHATFLEQSSRLFSVRKIPHTKMHPMYQHPSIDIYALKKLPQAHMRPERGLVNQQSALPTDDDQGTGEDRNAASTPLDDIHGSNECGSTMVPRAGSEKEATAVMESQSSGETEDSSELDREEGSELCLCQEASAKQTERSESGATWSSRRAGAEAARLLAGIEIGTE